MPKPRPETSNLRAHPSRNLTFLHVTADCSSQEPHSFPFRSSTCIQCATYHHQCDLTVNIAFVRYINSAAITITLAQNKMGTALLFFSALSATLTIAQQTTLPSTLPACAQQCTILTNAQQSCSSNPTAYQSCFCQSALLSQLYSSQPVQLCTQCSASDMASIQSWYKGTCQQGASPAANNQPTNTPSTTTSPPTTGPTTTTPPATGATVTNQQDSNTAKDPPKGPWYVLLIPHPLPRPIFLHAH